MIKADAVVAGLLQHLHSKGLVRWSLTQTFNEGPVPSAHLERMPSSPHTAVAVYVYNEDRTRDEHNPDIYVQLRFRAAGDDPRVVKALADNVFAELNWTDDHAPESWPGNIEVLHSKCVVRAPRVLDQNTRWESPDSYRLTINPGE